jgi:hypothetical protein
VPATARAAGLGGAYAAVVGDEGSVFVNPAGMAPIHRVALGLSLERGLLGTTLSTGAAVLRVGRFDVGLGLMYLDYGSDSVVVPDPAFGGDRGLTTGAMFSAYDALGVAALAYRRGMLSVGGSVKYLRQHIGTGDGGGAFTASGVAGDVGLTVAVFDIMALGFTVQNLGGGLTTSTGAAAPLPRTTRTGVTLNFIDPQGTTRLMMTADWIAPPGGDSWWALALEGGVVTRGVGVLGRAGFAAGRAPSDRQDLVYGGGIVLHALRIDYAYQGFDAVGSASHRFGVRWIP